MFDEETNNLIYDNAKIALERQLREFSSIIIKDVKIPKSINSRRPSGQHLWVGAMPTITVIVYFNDKYNDNKSCGFTYFTDAPRKTTYLNTCPIFLNNQEWKQMESCIGVTIRFLTNLSVIY